MALRVYDPKLVLMTFGPVPITGFADGTFVSVEMNADAFSLQVGTDGEGCRSKSNNYSARITFTLMQSSAANDLLSAQHNIDRLAPFGVTLPLMVKDASGRSLYLAEKSWVVRFPTAEFGREAGPREWVVETDNLISFTGGN